jgi:hypothetical protein
VNRISSRLGIVLVLALSGASLLAVARAMAEPASDQAVTAQILADLARAPAGQAQLVKEPAAEAKQALERAAGARRSGDVRHAEQLEGLAREWAETARDLIRAARAEADAGALETAAADAGVQAERARALLEESLARRGEAAAQLEQLSLAEAAAKSSKGATPPSKPSEKPRTSQPKKASSGAPKPPAERP